MTATLAAIATLGAAPGASAETLSGGINARTIEIAPGSASLPSPGAPDPSTIAASGLTGPVNSVSVLLREVSDPNAEGLAVLLVGPNGRGVVLMASYEGGRHRALRDVALSFSDSGQAVGCPEPEGSALTGAELAPFDCGLVSPFSFPAPSGPYASQLKELGSNGTWSLYVENTSNNEAFIAGGWILSVSTEAEALPLPVNQVNQYKPEGFTPAEFAEFEARQEQMRVEDIEREAQQRAREAQEQAARAAATSTTAKPVCVVPSLLGHGLADARRLSGVAHCKLGHVTTPRGHHGVLVIGAQHPRRGTRMVLGSSVSVTLKVKRR
ncbi:MAG TPA: hypothetical protein VN889_02200 [Solirubrobacteraceae bacterium]|nr:hypothetical protein [Solirubrobacteraceae bacterium]